jgi:branched-subunit amino acid transport protein
MNIWLVMLIGGLLTFAMRLSFIYLYGRFEVPETLRRALRFVPPAVLSAIIFPELLIRGVELDLTTGNERLLAGITAILTAGFTKNILLTILAGMAALLFLQFIR